jgi:hypothetical protein
MVPGVTGGATSETVEEGAKNAGSAPSKEAIEARVKAQKEALKAMSAEPTDAEKVACSIDNPEGCITCGS